MHFMGGYEKLMALQQGGDEAATTAWVKTWLAVMRDDTQNYLELATAYGDAGLYGDAEGVLARFSEGKQDAALNPMVNYVRGYYRELAGDSAAAGQFYAKAKLRPVVYTNPHRLEEADALEAALRRDPADAHAHLFLGNLLYAKNRLEEGFVNWQKAAGLDPKLELAWRNIAYGQEHFKNDPRASYETYRKALALDPTDARVLLELDQAAQRLGVPAGERFSTLESHAEAVNQRDDLIARLVDLRLEMSDRRNLELALNTLKTHHFHSWEGGYEIHNAWTEANERLGDRAFAEKHFDVAQNYYKLAGEYPGNLEVAPRTPDMRANIDWDFAKVLLAMGDRQAAEGRLKQILAEQYTKPDLGAYYQALAQKALGNDAAYRLLLEKIETSARARTDAAGHYLLALVLDQKDEKSAAEAERQKALRADPHAARTALTEAQIDLARAQQ